LAARPVTFAENGPLAPAGQCRNSDSLLSLEPVSQYWNQLVAAPLLAVPRACSVAVSEPMFVAGSVDA
jgi:hypothetical protein